MKYLVNGEPFETPSNSGEIEIFRLGGQLFVRGPNGTHSAAVVKVGNKTYVSYRSVVVEVEPASIAAPRSSASSGVLTAAMPGLIVDVLVQPGDTVVQNQKILVLEAMKTQQPFVAPFDGAVRELGVEKGSQVVEGTVLAVIEPLASPTTSPAPESANVAPGNPPNGKLTF